MVPRRAGFTASRRRHHIFVERVLEVGPALDAAEQTPKLVSLSQNSMSVRGLEAKPQMRRNDPCWRGRTRICALQRAAAGRPGCPAPDVAEPELRQTWIAAASAPRLWTVIRMSDVVDVRLGVFDLDIEIAVLVEQAGVDQLELRLRPSRARAFSSISH